MLWVIFAVLLVLWILGILSASLGVYVHIILIAAVVVILVKIINK
jgi:hypothetical protein